MKVDIKSFAHLRLALGSSPLQVDVPEGTTVGGLIDTLIDQYGDPVRTALWTRDGETLKVRPVLDGQVISLQECSHS